MARFYKAPLSPLYYRFGAQPIRWAAGWQGRTQSEIHAPGLGNASFPDSFYDQTYDQNLQKSYREFAPPRTGYGVNLVSGPRYGSPEPLSPQMYPLSGFQPTTLELVGAAVAVGALYLLWKERKK